jgi:hypothetical protein
MPGPAPPQLLELGEPRAGQTWLQLPQLFGSVFKFTQPELQAI